MRALVLAAGLGTRLRPWTLAHPKALVPVGGRPMLGRVLSRLAAEGFDEAVVNVHHFADQIIDFLDANDFGMCVGVSDESSELLDTGGGLAAAADRFVGEGPVLVHNADILSDAPLGEIMDIHNRAGNDITLLTSGRESSRKLVFDADGRLAGWHNLKDDTFRPQGFVRRENDNLHESAFSGIYVVGERALENIKNYGLRLGIRKFPIMDYLLSMPEGIIIRECYLPQLNLIDIGRPETLREANLGLVE